ncbi:unnamed protein product [Ambrosiozyma monospora]|uniref:Unnamed protein product n=1 Tax=Ambrosiozyma monospora TaxID=43982 RepID=A0A9W7DIT7_AMBMO|nr:unnamed protein product [Ambrosiozyma monospora]
MNQGWLLVLLTSLTTVTGCCVIYTDQIYKLLFPKRFAAHPFSIAHDTNFLICSLALSAGCLTLTSFYKLLPEAWKYLHKATPLKADPHLGRACLFTFFFMGVLGCTLLNYVIHFMTSESVVHCVHEGADHEHDHDESDHHHKDNDPMSHPHHAHHGLKGEVVRSGSEITNDTSSSTSDSNENTPLIPLSASVQRPKQHSQHQLPEQVAKKRVSLVDISLKAIKGQTMEGDCLGDMDECTPIIVCRHQLQSRADLHYCSIPSTENFLFIDKDNQLINTKDDLCSRFPDIEVTSPLLHDHSNTPEANNTPQTRINSIDESPNTSNQLQLQEFHSIESHSMSEHNHLHQHHSSPEDLEANKDLHHHHHIQTPLSRLLSIGVQTILAITLHKFPEGFIMYSTAQADPELGLSIFLSMFIHNFVEGFTMTLPLYVALDSRIKALLISAALGAFAQPVGALVGWYFFRGNFDMTDDSNLILIGALVAVTAGFLSYISFQMFASAIGFGGKQEKVMKWMFIGIFLIGLSEILVGKH